MNRHLAALLLSAIGMAGMATTASADNDVYVCVGENGVKEYKNTGITKGCKRVDLPGITTIPGLGVQRPAAASSGPRPADFPKVDSDTQKTRDNDRRQILQDEMRAEEQKLANLKRDYKGGEPERRSDERNFSSYQERVGAMKDDIARTEKNIEALKREIGNLK